MNQQLYYLYAIARPRQDQPIGAMPDVGIVPGTSVYSLRYRDLRAIVSRVPLELFDLPVLKAALEDTDWVHARVVTHQQVLLMLRTSYTLLPLKFCTLYRSEERIQELLADGYASLSQSLQRLVGATEWGVKLFYKPRVLTSWIEASAEALQPFREAVVGASTGASFFRQKKLALAAQQHVQQVVEQVAHTSHHTLSMHARQSVVHALQAPQTHGRRETMALNGAYLVDDQSLDRFQFAFVELAEQHEPQGFHYELTGPWPSYSFAALEELCPKVAN